MKKNLEIKSRTKRIFGKGIKFNGNIKINPNDPDVKRQLAELKEQQRKTMDLKYPDKETLNLIVGL